MVGIISWVPVSQFLSRICNQSVNQGCSYLKVWLGRESRSLVVVGKVQPPVDCWLGPCSSWILSGGYLQFFASLLIRASKWESRRDWARWKLVSFWNVSNDIQSFTVFCPLVEYQSWRGYYIRIWILGGKDHQICLPVTLLNCHPFLVSLRKYKPFFVGIWILILVDWLPFCAT